MHQLAPAPILISASACAPLRMLVPGSQKRAKCSNVDPRLGPGPGFEQPNNPEELRQDPRSLLRNTGADQRRQDAVTRVIYRVSPELTFIPNGPGTAGRIFENKNTFCSFRLKFNDPGHEPEPPRAGTAREYSRKMKLFRVFFAALKLLPHLSSACGRGLVTSGQWEREQRAARASAAECKQREHVQLLSHS